MASNRIHKRAGLDGMLFTLAFAGLFAFYEATGIGFSWDSSMYLLFSQQMRLNWDFSTGTTYAPFYPLVLGAISAVGIPTENAVSIVNAFSVAATLAATCRIVKSLTRSSVVGTLTGLFAATASASFTIFQNAWSEPLYSALLLVSVALIIELGRGYRRDLLVCTVTTLALLPITRFIGIFPVAFLFLLLVYIIVRREGIRRSSILTILVSGAVVGGPVSFFAFADYLLTGCPFGCRPPSSWGFIENIRFTRWALERDLPVYAGTMLVLAVSALAMLFRCHDRLTNRTLTQYGLAVTPAAVFAVQFIGQFYASMQAAIDPIGTRYLAPIYPLLLCSLISVAYVPVSTAPQKLFQRAFTGAIILAGIFAAGIDIDIYRGLLEESESGTASIASFGYKRNPVRAEILTEIADLLDRSSHPTLAVYHMEAPFVPAYLALNSAFYPDAYGCAPRSIERAALFVSRVITECRQDGRRKRLETFLLSDVTSTPEGTNLIIFAKDRTFDANLVEKQYIANGDYHPVFNSNIVLILRRRQD